MRICFSSCVGDMAVDIGVKFILVFVRGACPTLRKM
jgi:hypothetical protein